jgi:hypothetical protein
MTDTTQEAVVRSACEQHGRVVPSAVADVLEHFRAGRFAAKDALSFLDKIEDEAVGLVDKKPHWFTPKAGSDENLARQAFLFGSATAQAQYQRKHGAEAAIEAAQRFGNPFTRGVIGKPGKVAEDEAATSGNNDGRNNPWSAHWTDDKGKYTARAMAKQSELVRVMGAGKASAMAARHGVQIGATGIRPSWRVA